MNICVRYYISVCGIVPEWRIGEPLSVSDQLKPFRIYEPFALFTRESQQRYREQFEGVTRIVMARIEGMLDPKYRRGCAAS